MNTASLLEWLEWLPWPSDALTRGTGAGEVVQRVRALAALLRDLDSILSTHMAVHNCL